MTESDFTIVHLIIFFAAYIYCLCVYHRITNDLFSLHGELNRLLLYKQYKRTAPLHQFCTYIVLRGVFVIV